MGLLSESADFTLYANLKQIFAEVTQLLLPNCDCDFFLPLVNKEAFLSKALASEKGNFHLIGYMNTDEASVFQKCVVKGYRLDEKRHKQYLIREMEDSFKEVHVN